jgi:hypothetical protein
MTIDAFSLLAAAAGGLFGAAIGALQAFIFTGMLVVAGVATLAGTGNPAMLTALAFGPAFGPHISFAGGVAAAAYAARRKDVEGKDIVTPLARLARPDVLAVGAVFGVGGYVVQKAVAEIPWFGSHTDSVALTVALSALVARLAFGRTGILARGSSGAGGLADYAPDEDGRWVAAQERFTPNTVLGLGAGALAGFITLSMQQAFPALTGFAQTLPFALSAISLLFLSLGHAVPVTHHMTLPAGLAAGVFLPVVGGNLAVALLIGAGFGMVGAWFAEIAARASLSHGDTHVDPPAAAIWPATTLVLGLSAVLG